MKWALCWDTGMPYTFSESSCTEWSMANHPPLSFLPNRNKQYWKLRNLPSQHLSSLAPSHPTGISFLHCLHPINWRLLTSPKHTLPLTLYYPPSLSLLSLVQCVYVHTPFIYMPVTKAKERVVLGELNSGLDTGILGKSLSLNFRLNSTCQECGKLLVW